MVYLSSSPISFSIAVFSSHLSSHSRSNMVKCNCGAIGVIRTSTTKRNPGRAFYACPLEGPRSGFIKWVDEEKHGHEAEIKNEGLEIQIQELEVQNRNLKALLIISWFLFFGIVVYKL
ncbi:unnamed protein product [Lactuca saligna]|uniref:GRF-type domain-containing protein n=1 Tax=Lactuca saligna TaxID=75948 RepID=A0AA36DVG4_LACSI|nr:unnamed protein product [Lactuca saligna]CAI9273043.1 unnamed protein product [Lactuca saligna]CAI9286512.1 unnamed protein product [Lactuca saligna]CAI9289962.1 unnamed protein product [Lactuca saligna]